MALWSEISENVFCAFCKLERKVYTKKSIGWTNVLLSFVLSILLMYVIWQKPDGRVSLFLVLFLAVAEIFVRVRWRMSLPCQHCKFDPIVYKRDKQMAMKQVKAHLDQIQNDGHFMLKQNNPFQYLPKIRYNPETKEKTIS